MLKFFAEKVQNKLFSNVQQSTFITAMYGLYHSNLNDNNRKQFCIFEISEYLKFSITR